MKRPFDETAFQWEYIDQLAPRFKRHTRPILLTVNWAVSSGHTALIEAIHFLQGAFGQGRSLGGYPPAAFPLRFIPDSAKRYLYTQDAKGQRLLLPDRYEFLVYRLLRHGLEAGDVFCRDSVRFRSFEDDLLGDQRYRLLGKSTKFLLHQIPELPLAHQKHTKRWVDITIIYGFRQCAG